MPTKRPKLTIALLVLGVLGAGLLAVLGVRGIDDKLEPGPGEPLGLVTSLPIYWPDTAELTDFVGDGVEKPWTRAALEQDYVLHALDALAPVEVDSDPLPGLEMPVETIPSLDELDRLAIVQPRGLSAQDNVLIDEWVRGGGRLLLVLDPLLSGHYSMPVFDPRHPASTALVPPIVTRWGLSLAFDENQPLDVRVVEARHGLLPVIMAGEISIANADAAQCEIDGEGVIAHCSVGEGRVTLVADAALFEARDPGEEGEEILRRLFREALE